MFYDFVINVIGVLFLCGIVIWLDLSLNKKYSHYISGVMFGLITIFVMSANIKVIEGRFYDFRHIIMTMAGFVGGPITAVIAAIIGSLYRYNVGGSGLMGGITNIIVFACFGSILGRRVKTRQNGKRIFFWFLIGIVMAFILMFIIAFIPPWKTDSVKVLRVVAAPFLIITPLATTLIFNFYFWTCHFFGKASILNAIINCSPINLMIYDAHGPIMFSQALKTSGQSFSFIDKPNLLLDPDKTGLNATLLQYEEIALEDGRHFVADLSSFQMPNGENACLAIIRDITERKLALEELNKSQKEMASILESMTDRFYAINMNSQFTYINRACEKIFEKTRDELLGRKITEVFDVNETTLLHFHEVMSKKRSVSFETISRALNNKWLEISLYPTETGLTCYFRDITSRKISEGEIARLDRLNLVGQLAAGIGHEIRNPMTTVRGYLQLLGVKPEYVIQKPTFELMISELDRANSIITEFLSLAQTRQSALKTQNLNDILNTIYPLLESDAFTQNKQLDLFSGEIPDLKLSGKEITQLLLNLIRNGLESMNEGGTVTIKSYVDGDKAVLAIEDEGCGIPEENLNKLGTPFFTTKESGTGLGLATCYKIAESHNAKIQVNSSFRGTTFFIFFPIPDKEQEQDEMIA